MMTEDTVGKIVTKLLISKGLLTQNGSGAEYPDTETNDFLWATTVGGGNVFKLMNGTVIAKPVVQLRSRSRNPDTANQKLVQCLAALCGYKNETVVIGAKSYSFLSFNIESTPVYMGLEEKYNRHHFVADGSVSVKPL